MERSNRRLAAFLALLVFLNIVLRWRRYHFQGKIGARRGLPILTYDLQAALPGPVGTLLEELQHGGDFTLFAPSQEAYSSWLQQQAGNGEGMKDRLHALLADHTLDELLLVEDVPDDGMVVTVSSGKSVEVHHGMGGGLAVNGFVSERCNFEKGEGVVHIINGVLFSSQQAASAQYSPASAKEGNDLGVNRSVCAGRGSFMADRGCGCAALYRGSECQYVKTTTAWPDKSDGYFGPLVLNQAHLRRMTDIKALTPGKQLTILQTLTPAMRAQLAGILPERDEVSSSQFHSCALVGGSGILMRYNSGAEIDSHEMVLRFNSAPTAGYEEHVGSRTTYRVSNGEHLNVREGNETIIHHLKARSFLAKLMLYAAIGKPPPLMFDPDFTSFVSSTLTFIPSSGYFAILMALQVCQRISLYGFFVSDRHGARHHYFNSETPSNARRDDTEYSVAAALARAGILRFREPCIMECHDSQGACQECLGDTPLEELAALERWSPEQAKKNADREAAFVDSRKWDWGIEDSFAFSETEGVVRKPPRPPKPGRASDPAPGSAQRQRSKGASGAARSSRGRGSVHL